MKMNRPRAHCVRCDHSIFLRAHMGTQRQFLFMMLAAFEPASGLIVSTTSPESTTEQATLFELLDEARLYDTVVDCPTLCFWLDKALSMRPRFWDIETTETLFLQLSPGELAIFPTAVYDPILLQQIHPLCQTAEMESLNYVSDFLTTLEETMVELADLSDELLFIEIGASAREDGTSYSVRCGPRQGKEGVHFVCHDPSEASTPPRRTVPSPATLAYV
jgi:hypothetical protein